MTYTYDAELTVNSVIDNLTDAGLPDGDPEINIFTTDGIVRTDGNEFTIDYVEKNEDYKTYCTLTVNGEVVKLSRRGAVECDILFDTATVCDTIYRVPPYAFDMSVRTARVRNSLTESGGDLRLIYLMNIGGQDKKVRMSIKVKPFT
jgi:uncharacterized beta-barrel protein YwiB (DUF1934 family)